MRNLPDTPKPEPPLCDNDCGNPHGYKCYEVIDKHVFWFNCEWCRTDFMSKLPLSDDKSAGGVA